MFILVLVAPKTVKTPFIWLLVGSFICTSCTLPGHAVNTTRLSNTTEEQTIPHSRYELADGSTMPWSGAIMWPTDIGEQQIIISCDEKDNDSNIEAIEQIVHDKTLGIFLEENCFGKAFSSTVKQSLSTKQFPSIVIDTHQSMYRTLAWWNDDDYRWVSNLNTHQVEWVLPKTETQKMILKQGVPKKIYTSDTTHLWRDSDDNMSESILFLSIN